MASGAEASGLPIILLLALVAAGLCWLFASRLASPVRELAKKMGAFGRGEMAVRSSIRRKDEIGGLARSFNRKRTANPGSGPREAPAGGGEEGDFGELTLAHPR